MAHNTDKVGFPNIPLRAGMVLKLEARDPTTDAEVGGVSATRWSIFGDDQSAPSQPQPAGPVLIVPTSGGAPV